MSQLYRRVVLKPPELDGEAHAQLAKRLEAAVEAQKQLASRSPHILQLVGTLQEDEHCFFVEHEPAGPLPLAGLFDPAAPGADRESIWRMSIALFDALRAAHTTQAKQPVVHGGLCPGVLLRDLNGVEKLADFGFGPAICDALGEQQFLNLAVLAPLGEPDIEGATGVWEVLDPGVHDRDDRICGFIDPEKYGSQLYRSFERSGDIIAAGFLLYLLTEHRHPYFYNEPEVLRSAEMAEEAMAYGAPVPFNTLRPELRESEEPAVKVWRELLWEMIDRIPQGRPSAPDIVKRLKAVGIKPVEPDEIMVRRLEVIGERLSGATWQELGEGRLAGDVGPLTEAADMPAHVTGAARFLLTQGEHLQRMASDEWEAAARELIGLATPASLPGGLTRCVETMRQRAAAAQEAHRNLKKIEAALAGSRDLTLAEADTAIDTLQAYLTQHSGAASLPPTLQEQALGLWRTLARRRAEIDPNIERIRSAAQTWMADLRQLLETGQWDKLEEGLRRRDDHPKWLIEIDNQAADLAEQVARYRTEETERQRLREELRGQLKQAAELLNNQDFDGARALLEPILRQHAHSDLADQARTLRTRVDDQESQISEQREHQVQARQRAESLLDAVEATINQPPRMLDETSLGRADAIIEEVMAIPHLLPAQRERARDLAARIAQLREQVFDLVDQNIRQLERQEQDLARAQTEFDQGHLLKARHVAELLVRSEFPTIVEAAQELLRGIEGRLDEARQQLRQRLDQADELLKRREFDAVVLAARQVLETDYADLALRDRSEQLIQQTEALQDAEKQARQATAGEYERALASFQLGDLVTTRRVTEDLLANPHTEDALARAARQLLDCLPALESAQALADQGQFSDALRAFDQILAQTEPGGRQAQVATLLRKRAKNRQAEVLIAGLRKHLRRRAERGQLAAGSGELIDSKSSMPQWLQVSLATIDNFVDDRSSNVTPDPQIQPLAPADRLGDKYEIIESLGRGGMGEVYRARDLDLDREVALKLTPAAGIGPELDKALENEAKAIARLSHPHIMHINSSGVLEGRRYFDTNYIRGQDLASYLRKEKVSERQAAEVVIAVAEALAYAHQHGVLHRDVKPQNIYLGEEPGEGPWLIDFGLAYMRSMTDQRVRTGLCGTPGYIAPEVITTMGDQVDQRADIFALGCVLYELLAGRPPFHEAGEAAPRTLLSVAALSQTLLNTLRAHFRPLAKAAPQVRPELARICEKAIADDPQERYATAADLAAALQSFLKTLEIEEAQSDLKQARTRFEQRKRNDPAELADLDDALRLAEAVRHHGNEDIRNRVKSLVEEIQAARKDITARQAKATRDLRAAGEAHTAGDYQGAIDCAQAVLAVPYVPNLHGEARGIQEKARTALAEAAEADARRQRARRSRQLQMAAVGLVVLLAAGGGGYWWMNRPAPTPLVQHTEPVDVPPGPTEPPVVSDPPVTPSHDPTPPPTELPDEPPPLPPTEPPIPSVSVTMTIDPPRIPEAGGKASIALRLAAEATGEVTIALDFEGSTAESGKHFTVAGLGDGNTVALRAGQTGQEITIQAVDDNVFNPGKFVTVRVASAAGARLERQPTVTAAIIDDDRAGLICSRSRIQVRESEEETYTVKLASQPTLSVTVAFEHDAAGQIEVRPAKLDFTADNWSEAQTVTVAAVRDRVVDGDRNATIRLTADSEDANYRDLQLEPIELNVIDEDRATVAFVLAESQVKRSALAGHTIAVRLEVAEGGRVAEAVPVQVLDAGEGSELGVVEFPANAQSQELTWTVADATAPQSREVLTLRLEFSPALRERLRERRMSMEVGAPRQHTLRITTEMLEVRPPEVLALLVPALLEQAQGPLAWLRAFAAYLGDAEGAPELLGQPLGITSTREQVTSNLAYPWGEALSPLLLKTEELGTGDPAAVVAAKLVEHLKTQVPAERQQYLRWWVQRQDLEQEIERDLQAAGAAVQNGQPVDVPGGSAKAWHYLQQIARIKWMSEQVAAGEPSLEAWTNNIRQTLSSTGRSTDNAIFVRPHRFIEFFWGQRHVHAIYWLTPTNDDNSQTVYARYVRLGPARELSQTAVRVTQQADAEASRTLGAALLQPIVSEPDFFKAGARSFGIILAPDGPLCFLPLLHLPFAGITPDITTDAETRTDQTVQRKVEVGDALHRLSDLCANMNRDLHISVWTWVSAGPSPGGGDNPAQAWRVPWQIVTGEQTAALESMRYPGTRDLKISNAVFVYALRGAGRLDDWLAGQVQTEVSRPIASQPKDLDGGFLNPRLNVANAPGWLRLCVLVSDPVRSKP